jgi:predicted transcriptional regulator
LTSPKPKRGRFSQKRRKQGNRLAQLLRQQRYQFPSYAPYLDEFARRIDEESERTRETDRERVIGALVSWGALSVREIMEDTGLSHWDVRQVLAPLIKRGKVEETRPPVEGIPPAGRPLIYRLKE